MSGLGNFRQLLKPVECAFCLTWMTRVMIVGGPAICIHCLEKIAGAHTYNQGGAMLGKIPFIGQLVHYTNLGDRDGKYPPTVQAAVITGVNDDGTVALHVFYKTGQFDLASCEETPDPAGSEPARGKWSVIR